MDYVIVCIILGADFMVSESENNINFWNMVKKVLFSLLSLICVYS